MIRAARLLACLALGALAVALVVPAASAGQTKSQSAAVTATFTIVAIDQTTRLVTLKDKDGYVDSVYAGPEVQRFSELKVGDTVTFTYYESVVYQIRSLRAAEAPGSAETNVVRNTGPRPGGTMSRQLTATVTVLGIDLTVPSVKFKAEDGSITNFKVEDKKALASVKVGDRVQITYTEALAVSVAPGK
jgi:hypothetical protein